MRRGSNQDPRQLTDGLSRLAGRINLLEHQMGKLIAEHALMSRTPVNNVVPFAGSEKRKPVFQTEAKASKAEEQFGDKT